MYYKTHPFDRSICLKSVSINVFITLKLLQKTNINTKCINRSYVATLQFPIYDFIQHFFSNSIGVGGIPKKESLRCLFG